MKLFYLTLIGLFLFSNGVFAQLSSSDNNATPTLRCKTATSTDGINFSIVHGFGKVPDKVSVYYSEYFTGGETEMSGWYSQNDTTIDMKFPTGQDISPTKPVRIIYCTIDLIGSAFDSFAKRDEVNAYSQDQAIGDITTPLEILHISKNQDANTRIRVDNSNTGANANAGIELTSDGSVAQIFNKSVAGGDELVIRNSSGIELDGVAQVEVNASGTCGTGNVCSSGAFNPGAISQNAACGTITDHKSRWIRVGNVVTVNGIAVVTGASLGGLCNLRYPLPISRDITAITNLSGVVSVRDGANTYSVGVVWGNIASDTSDILLNMAGNNGSQNITYSYSYFL